MTLRKLQTDGTGNYICPACGNILRFVEGGAVRVINGKLDMDNIKPRYECDTCGVFYREALSSGYFDVFPLEVSLPPQPVTSDKIPMKPEDYQPVPLKRDNRGQCACPLCGENMRFVEGGAVRLVQGHVDMENVKPRFECSHCGVFYREILSSGYFDLFPLENETEDSAQQAGQSAWRSTGELQPMKLKCDENNQCVCPRCGDLMDFVEGEPVHLVNGKPDMENVLDHFRCGRCGSVYRRIVNTDYFQWTEK